MEGKVDGREPPQRAAPLYRAARSMLARVEPALARARREIAPRARDAWQHLARTSPRVRYATVAAGTLAVGIAVLATVHGLRGGPEAGDAVARDTDAVAPVKILEIARPVLVHVEAGSTQAVCSGSDRDRRRLAEAAARQILPAADAHPREAIVVNLRDVPLSYALLPKAEQAELERRFGRDAARRYEADVAALLNTIITVVQREHPRAVLGVLGLPVEPEQAGVPLEVAQQTNARYGTVIDRLGPLVPARRFVVFGSTLDEALLARMGMREALRLRDGRPIVFQTNVVWQALMNEDARDDPTYLVTRPEASRRVEVQAALVDDSY